MPDLIIRPAQPADADAIALVQVNTWKSTYAGMMPEASLAFFTDLDWRRQRWRETLETAEQERPMLRRAYVAETAAHDIVGFAITGPARHSEDDPPEATPYEGEVYAIYVLAGQQGKGAGRQLMEACADHLRACGLKGIVVWALEANISARGFYERLGGRLIGRKQIDLAGAFMPEVGYGWE